MFGVAKTPDPKPTPYATSADFCRIFQRDMNRLYLLSLLLTGNQGAAEKCFVQGLSDSKRSNAVFKEWAEAWARRKVIQNAIELVHPRPTGVVSPENTADRDVTHSAETAAILELPAFDRFAYVLSVLEGYSLHECAILLECRRDEVNTARMRALQEIVKSVEHQTTNRLHPLAPTLPETVELRGLSNLAAAA
jgi:DNA-directed RNA polymerase specialized sigma24 family protein